MKVLFITQSKVSDAVMSTVVLDRILHAYPQAVIDVATDKHVADLFRAMPNLGRISGFRHEKGWRVHLKIWRKFFRYKYDVIVDLRDTPVRHLLRGKETYSFDCNPERSFAEQMAELFPLKEYREPQQILWENKEMYDKVSEFVRGRGLLIGLSPSTSWLSKSWPQRNFALVVSKLMAHPGFENVTFVVFGTEREKHLVNDLVHYIPADRCINLVGRTSLSEAFAWMKHLDGFLGNDNGSTHMAAAAGIPVVTLFGPTCERLRAPLAKNSRLIVAPERERHEANLPSDVPCRVMTDIEPDYVFENIIDMVKHLRRERKKHA